MSDAWLHVATNETALAKNRAFSYAEVVIGAPGVAGGQAGLYYGDGGPGVSLTPRQRQSDDAGPIAPGGRGASATAFQLALTGRAPGGRGRVRLAWQVAPVGTPFTATTVLSGTTAWTDTLTAGVPLTQGVSGLSAGTAYHWRARLEYPAATGQRAGRWLTPAGQAAQAPALRTATGATLVTRTLTYAYDPLGRLVGATYSSGEAYAYQYDAAGHRTALTETTPLSGTTVTTYTYDAANRLTSAGGVPHTWDARGNLTGDGVFTYTYNTAGQWVRAQSGNATLVYTYTADGLRVAQSVNGAVTSFVWDWAVPVVPELLSSGATRYLLGAETLGQWDGTAWAYTLPDALGSVRQTVDRAGAVTADREWSPYGEEVGGTQAGLGYTGEWQDADVGLVYLRARWYQAETGRFTQVDPLPGQLIYPHTYNHYLYAANSPLVYFDASGQRSIPWWLLPLLIVFGGCTLEAGADPPDCSSVEMNLTLTGVECRGKECSTRMAAAFWLPNAVQEKFREKCAVIQWAKGTFKVDEKTMLCSGLDCGSDESQCLPGENCQMLSNAYWHVDQYRNTGPEYTLIESFKDWEGVPLTSKGYIEPDVPRSEFPLYMIDSPAIRGNKIGQTIEAHVELITAVYNRADLSQLPSMGGSLGNPDVPSPCKKWEWRFDAGPYITSLSLFP